MRVVARWAVFALLAGLVGCRGPAPAGRVDGAVADLVSIPLGGVPVHLTASRDGRVLVAWGGEDHGLSIVDIAGRREVRRLAIPVRETDPEGNPTYGCVAGVVLDDGAATAWAATTEGQVFRIDLASGEIRTLVDDPSHAFSAVVHDPDRDRILLATEEGSILAFGEIGLRHLESVSMGITMLARTGPKLFVVEREDAIWGEGLLDSGVAAIDLVSNRQVAGELLETGIAMDLAVLENGHVLVADEGNGRLLEFAPGLVLEVTREMPSFYPGRIAVDGRRVLVASLGSPARPVLEYRLVDGSPSVRPSAEYLVEDAPVNDIAPLGGGWFAIAHGDRREVNLFHESRARPFSGFPQP